MKTTKISMVSVFLLWAIELKQKRGIYGISIKGQLKVVVVNTLHNFKTFICSFKAKMIFSEAVARRYSVKNVFLKGLQSYLKKILAQVFSCEFCCEFCEIFKKTFFIAHVWWLLLSF